MSTTTNSKAIWSGCDQTETAATRLKAKHRCGLFATTSSLRTKNKKKMGFDSTACLQQPRFLLCSESVQALMKPNSAAWTPDPVGGLNPGKLSDDTVAPTSRFFP